MTKKIFGLLGTLVVCGMVQAQLLKENEMALVYYAPKNYVVLDFEYSV